jgi:hypothetical protein
MSKFAHHVRIGHNHRLNSRISVLHGRAPVAVAYVVPEAAEETVVIGEASLMQDMIRLWPPTAGSTVRSIGGEL